ncbi:MAG TPA: STAS domain-containing protein [Actinomycetes bacterium]|jgi:anti-anti-sigma factor|nr:STAS domain-containing protein [Actinomycetes bacterium]
MGRAELRAAVRRHGGTEVIDLTGDIDRDADAVLQRAYDEASGAGTGPVLLNFAGVGYINSTGIAVILGVLARARKERRPLVASGLSEHYQQIFQITRLSDFIAIYPDEDSAVGGATTGDADGVRTARGGHR